MPLMLLGDRKPDMPSLADFLTGSRAAPALSALIEIISDAAIPLADRLAQGRLPGDPSAVVGTNDSGDRQKALDLAAHDHMLAALGRASVRAVLSEEACGVIELMPDGAFDVAIDPIDGSGSIGIGAPLGLVFAVFPAGDGFLRAGRDIVAAGYVSFGHSTDMGFSLGRDVAIATLDREAGTFRVVKTDVTLPEDTSMVAYNASNVRHLSPGLRRYLGDLIAGSDGPRGRDFNMRWLAAAVGELHRIMMQGGLFMYPADARPGYADGRLRLIYEAFPIAWLIERAGGSASDGAGPILDRVPEALHQKTPLIFGARNEVAALLATLADTAE